MAEEIKKIRCQSCSIPLDEGFFGTEADGSFTQDYCRFCYEKGVFTEPEVTCEQMVQRTISFMTGKLKINEGRAREFSTTVIPKLKRWNPSEF